MKFFIGTVHNIMPIKPKKFKKDVAKSVSNFGGNLVTPSSLSVITCYAAGHLKVRFQNVLPAPPKSLHIQGYVSRK